MTIQKLENNGEITIVLDGWLDTLSSPELGKQIEKIESATAITLDFDKVEYISSSGLRQVVSCHKKAKELNAAFSVINVCKDTMNIFKLTNLDKKLSVIAK